jgi:hypothetical protein
LKVDGGCETWMLGLALVGTDVVVGRHLRHGHRAALGL